MNTPFTNTNSSNAMILCCVWITVQMEHLTATNIEGALSMNTPFTNGWDTSDAVMHVISE